jgi:ribosomal protein S18 acetylase RimI-like enzyme
MTPEVERSTAPYVIVPFESTFGDAFRTLNLAWLVENDLYEKADDKQLDHPEEIIANGGEIHVALIDSTVIGTAALIPLGNDRIELAKVCVAASTKGRGVGRALTVHSLERAAARGYRTVFLTTSSKLVAAIQLYESIGFRRVPVPAWSPYATADIAMEFTFGDAS